MGAQGSSQDQESLSTGPERSFGCLLGLAVGDAIGLVIEGNPPSDCLDYGRRLRQWAVTDGGAAKVFPVDSYFPFGQVSDDTQLALLLFDLLLVIRPPTADASSLAHQYAARLAAFQGRYVGLGMATAKAITRLVKGDKPYLECATARGQAGNSPAVRAVAFCALGALSELEKEHEILVKSMAFEQSRVTHLDERCSEAAALVAFIVRLLMGKTTLVVAEFVMELVVYAESIPSKVFRASLAELGDLLRGPVDQASKRIARIGMDESFNDGSVGISGFVVSSTIWSLYCFLKHPTNFMDAMVLALNGGGDCDSTCALAGAFVGAFCGAGAIPEKLASLVHDQSEWSSLRDRLKGNLGIGDPLHVLVVNCLNDSTDTQANKVVRERFKRWLGGAHISLVNPMDGDLPTNLSTFAGVIVTGSPVKAFDADCLWLAGLKTWLLQSIIGQIKVLGLCFGCQVLAMCLGGECKILDEPEIGLRLVQGSSLSVLPSYRIIETHAEHFTLPADSKDLLSLGSTQKCLQGFVSRDFLVFGLQGHPEYTNEDGRVRFWKRFEGGEVSRAYYDDAVESLQCGENDGDKIAELVILPWLKGSSHFDFRPIEEVQ